MTLTQLEYVLAVDKFRHFGKAAMSCHVTQPSLSMQLQKLEEELGIVLFDRSKSPILPTLDGRKIIEQAKRVIREYKRIHLIIEQEREEIEGPFRLAVIPTISPYLVPLFAGALAKKYPKMKLIIEEHRTDEILTLLENDTIDAALMVTPLRKDSLIERVLYYEPFYLFVEQGHPLFKKKSITQDDLDLREIWLLDKGNCFRDQVLKICSNAQSLKMDELPIFFQSGSFETLKNMVLYGSGYTILPYLAVNQLCKDQQKRVRPFVRPIPTREVSLVYARTFHKEKMINVVEQTILEVIPKELDSYKKRKIEVVEVERE